MGVQACRLPGLKHSLGMLHPAANRHPKATHQWLLIGVQACRLPALKRLKPLKTLQTLKTSYPSWRSKPAINGFLWASKPAVCQALNIPLACFILQPTGTPRLHINVFLWASKPAVCQPLNAVKPLKTLKTFQTLTTRHGGPSLPFARPSTFPWHASSCTPGHTSMASYRRQACRLPALKRLKPLKTLQTLKTSYGRPSLPFARP